MRPKIEISSQALNDLDEIVDYIAQDNPETAENFGKELVKAAYALEKSPFMGAVIEERPDVRMIVYRPYLIFYTIDEADNRIEIARFWHGARDRKGLNFDL